MIFKIHTLFTLLIVAYFQSSSGLCFFGGNFKFSQPESVKVVISSRSCETAGMTHDDLAAWIETALEDYWNTISTSSLKLELAGVVDRDIDSDVNPVDNTILVGCSTNTLFSSSLSYPEAVAGMSRYGGKTLGYVYVNNNYPGGWSTGNYDRLMYVMIHEIGHTLGLTHSDDPTSVMSYNTNNTWRELPTSLSQDDRDGITFLYPYEKKLAGLLGSCGTITFDDQNGEGDFTFLLQLLIAPLLLFLLQIAWSKTDLFKWSYSRWKGI